WYWTERSVQSNQGAAWRNPGDRFGTGCVTWTRKTSCGSSFPDQVFRLHGTTGVPPPEPPPPPPPPPPADLLYDQYNNTTTSGWFSQQEAEGGTTFDSELADDFVVPGSVPGWLVDRVMVRGFYSAWPGPVRSFNVRVYSNGAGDLPGVVAAERIGQTYSAR